MYGPGSESSEDCSVGPLGRELNHTHCKALVTFGYPDSYNACKTLLNMINPSLLQFPAVPRNSFKKYTWCFLKVENPETLLSPELATS
jgi:hypothetical protein